MGGKEPVQLKREQRSTSQLAQIERETSKSQLQKSRYYDGFQHGKMNYEQAPKLKNGKADQAN